MARRSIDTSEMFRSMTSRKTAAAQHQSSPRDTEEAIRADEVYETNDIVTESTESTHSNAQDKNAIAESPVEQKNKTKQKKAGKIPKKPNEKQSVKLGFYLTPDNYAAMKLHKAINGIGSHKDSSIINEALKEYLKKEHDALSNADETMSDDERFSAALRSMLS